MNVSLRLRAKPFAGQTTPSGRAPLSVLRTPVCALKCRASGSKFEAASSASRIELSRRQAMLFAAGALALPAWEMLAPAADAGVIIAAPQGYRVQNDKLDGYAFCYPENWIAVTSSGNDFFVRNPRNLDENIFIDISSPSSSRYNSVEDLGTPQQAAINLLDQLLNKEFMSTRIGIKREGEVLSATSRVGADGKTYYDIGLRITSYASRSPYVSNPQEVMKDYGVEFDRRFQTTLGTANKRLYELRMQTSMDAYPKSQENFQIIANSFAVRETDLILGTTIKPSSLRAPARN